MQFTFEIDVPANTTKTDPVRETAKLGYGELKKVQIDFPWGCASYVGIRILHFEHILYPTNTDKWFIGNEVSITFECAYYITQGIGDFKIEAYNEDDFYLHSPVISFNVLPIMGLPSGEAPWVEG